jgi:tetraacyldisaccharide 4'-kinase
MVEYLIRLLQPHQGLAVLSRGYGRQTRGFRLAQNGDSYLSIGDEPLQMFQKFRPDLTVAVGESRALAIPKILFEKPDVQTILLDDAFQHRSVIPQLSIVVTDYWAPFFSDSLMPSGRLREPRDSISRADIVVVTKCPLNLDRELRGKLTALIRKYHSDVPVFFTAISYKSPRHFGKEELLEAAADVLLVSGIAKPDTLVKYVLENYTLVKHMRYGDHYQYRNKDIENIIKEFERLQGKNKAILTTEKDWIRLVEYQEKLANLPVYYLPIESIFLEDGSLFDKMVLNSLSSVENSKT